MTSETLGFANLPNQVHRKSVKKGFDFTLMVVGEPGLGKSTLINTLFRTDLYKDQKRSFEEEKLISKVEIKSQTVDIEERGVKLRLTVVDTPGYGEGLDSSNSFQTIVDHIDRQFDKYFQHENGLNRRNIVDSRVHCCFYFISPVGYSLKPIDLAFMKLMHKKVNIIPLIAKADVLTRKEIKEMKARILKDIESNGITIYSVPECEPDEEPDYKEQMKQLMEAIPFAISASQEQHEVRGKNVFGRAYPWGVVETENPDHSDFVRLRSLLVTHMQDLREVTQEVHYENYRSHRLANTSGQVPYVLETSIDDDIERDREKDRIMKQKDEEMRRMQMMIQQMQQQLNNQYGGDSNSVSSENTNNGV